MLKILMLQVVLHEKLRDVSPPNILTSYALA